MLLFTRTLNDLVSRVASYIMVYYYMISLILCTLQLNDFYEVSIEAQLIFLIGTLSLWCGFIRCKISKRDEYINRPYLEQSSKRILSSIFVFFFIVGFCLFCLPYIPKALLVAEMQGGAEMSNKDEVIFGGDNLTTILYNIGMAIASKVALALIPVSVVTGLWKKYFHLLAVCLVLQLFYVILTGGRGQVLSLLFALFYVIICFNSNKKNIRFSKKQMISLGLLFAFSFYLMTLVTNFRGHGDFKMDEREKDEANKSMALTFLNYTVVPINLFDVSLKENYKEKFGGNQYGKATFVGVDYLIESVAKRMGISYKTDLYIVEYVQDNRKQCAKDREYNYAYSMFFYNYMDFGLLGVVLIPFIFGYFIRYAIKKYYEQSNFLRMLMVVLMFNLMFTSHFTSPFIRPWDMLYLIILLLLDWYMRIRQATRKHIINKAIKENEYC